MSHAFRPEKKEWIILGEPLHFLYSEPPAVQVYQLDGHSVGWLAKKGDEVSAWYRCGGAGYAWINRYGTFAEARAAVEGAVRASFVRCFRCGRCGAPEDQHSWMESVGAQLLKEERCHSCNFWEEQIANHKRDKHCFVAGGAAYTIGSEASEGASGDGLGFGGRRFLVKFNDGREVRTRNLWHQGSIPELFRSEMPDTAILLSGDREWITPQVF